MTTEPHVVSSFYRSCSPSLSSPASRGVIGEDNPNSTSPSSSAASRAVYRSRARSKPAKHIFGASRRRHPPIPSKVLEKIRRWEYIDLAMLLANDTPDDNLSTVVFNGQALVVSPSANPTKKRKIALDIQSWLQAYSMYAAALISADSTTKPESAGLLAHMFSVLQLAKDLGGSQWVHYDKSFREWAAAKNVRSWGELNLPIFCQCMASQERVAPFSQLLESGPKGGSSSVSGFRGCRAWNLEKACRRSGCRFSHSCYFCGGSHRAPNCPSRSRQGPGR